MFGHTIAQIYSRKTNDTKFSSCECCFIYALLKFFFFGGKLTILVQKETNLQLINVVHRGTDYSLLTESER